MPTRSSSCAAGTTAAVGGRRPSLPGRRRFDLVAERPLPGPVWDVAVTGGTILVSGPASSQSYNGVLNASFDGGKTWSRVAEAVRGGRFRAIR